ncbi:MAG: SIS domain-containing protein [bacterium]|nr:SIS domain-containing protein [bacterium]MDZ4284259.1 SIS domain-containing protein [Patescibacteria group bacterium]
MGQLAWNCQFFQYLQQIDQLAEKMRNDKELVRSVEHATQCLISTLGTGHKILIAGNGGSAAHAQHFAAELVGRFARARRALPALALTTDTSIITAWSNDFSFEDVFARQIEALGAQRDIFLALSTSGNSSNVIVAQNAAKLRGLRMLCLLGKGGGKLLEACELEDCIVVPSDNTQLIQDAHQWILHHWCAAIDEAFSSMER